MPDIVRPQRARADFRSSDLALALRAGLQEPDDATRAPADLACVEAQRPRDLGGFRTIGQERHHREVFRRQSRGRRLDELWCRWLEEAFAGSETADRRQQLLDGVCL